MVSFGSKQNRSRVRRIIKGETEGVIQPDWLWVIQEYTALERLDVQLSLNSDSSLWRAMSNKFNRPVFSKLVSLNVQFSFTGVGYRSECEFISAFPSLKKLTMQDASLNATDTLSLARSCSQLEDVELGSISFLHDMNTDQPILFPNVNRMVLHRRGQFNGHQLYEQAPLLTNLSIDGTWEDVWNIELARTRLERLKMGSQPSRALLAPNPTTHFERLRVLDLTESIQVMTELICRTPLVETLELNMRARAQYDQCVPLVQSICTLKHLQSLTVRETNAYQPSFGYVHAVCNELFTHIESLQCNGHSVPFNLQHLKLPLSMECLRLLNTDICRHSLECLELQIMEHTNMMYEKSAHYDPRSEYELSWDDGTFTQAQSTYETWSDEQRDIERVVQSSKPRLNSRVVIRQCVSNVTWQTIIPLFDVISWCPRLELYGETIGAVGHRDMPDPKQLQCLAGDVRQQKNSEQRVEDIVYALRDRCWTSRLTSNIWHAQYKRE
jgi:hypothetical protein